MPISIVSTVNTTGTSVSLTTSGVDRAVVVFVSGANLTKPTAITYGGVSLSKIVENTTAATRYAAIWLLLNAPLGTNSLVLNQNGGYRVVACALQDVLLGAGVVGTNTNQSTSTEAIGVTISNLIESDWVLATMGAQYDVTSFSVTTGTQIYNDNNHHVSAYRISPDTSATVNFAINPGSNVALAALALRAADSLKAGQLLDWNL